MRSCPPATTDLSNEVLDDALDALEAARLLAQAHPGRALELAHESIRLTLEAFLGAQGLRADVGPRRHAVVTEAVLAQIGHVLGPLGRQLDAIRIERNLVAYAGGRKSVTTDAAMDVIDSAADVHRGMSNIVRSAQVPLWR